MAFELCHRLGLRPDFEPTYGSQTADLRIQIGNQRLAAEAFRCSRLKSTLVDGGYHDAGQTSKKIRDSVSEKANKYKNLQDPLVVLVLYAGYDVDHQDLEGAATRTTFKCTPI